MIAKSLFVSFALIGIITSIYLANSFQEHEKDLDWNSFIAGKLALLAVPDLNPSNTTKSVFLERQKFNSFMKWLIAPVDRLLKPELGLINYKEFNIPVEALTDRLTGKVEDFIMLRVYTPPPLPKKVSILKPQGSSLKPVLVWFHGGGWVVGSAQSDHSICLKFAHYTNFVVVNVDYRLAPNFIFPTAVNDVYESLTWVREHIHEHGGDASRILVAGESAGGTLAAAVTGRWLEEQHKVKTRSNQALDVGVTDKLRIIGSLFVYPPLDTITNSTAAEIYDQTNGLLRLSNMEWFRQLYQGEEGYNPTIREHFWFSPLLTPSHLIADYPPSIFILAKYDILTEENVRFAELLQSHGRHASLTMFQSTAHGFFGRPLLSTVGDEAIKHASNELKRFAKI